MCIRDRIGTDIFTQFCNAAFLDAQRLCKCIVEFRQMRPFDFLYGNGEFCRFACHILAMIVFRESQRENLGFADFHATNRIFEFRQDVYKRQGLS